MSVKSVFEFKFSAPTREEGLRLAEGIGNDMPPLKGYMGHEVIRDVADPGHVMVSTHWRTLREAEAILSKYQNDPKVKRATELLAAPPNGFIGDVLPRSA